MKEIIISILLGILSIACYALSGLQFSCKGFPLNNSYIYASKKERESMDKAPYYRQSGIVFSLVGTMFLLDSIEVVLSTGWMLGCVIALMIVTTVYAIVSTVIIEKRKSGKN